MNQGKISRDDRRTLRWRVVVVSAATGAIAWVIGSQTGGVNLLAGLGAALMTTFVFGRWWALPGALPGAVLLGGLGLMVFPLAPGYAEVWALPFLGLACGILHELRVERSPNPLLTVAACGAATFLGGLGVNEAMAHRLIENVGGALLASVVYGLALGGTVLGGLALARLGGARDPLVEAAERVGTQSGNEARELALAAVRHHRALLQTLGRTIGSSPGVEGQLRRLVERLIELTARSQAVAGDLEPGREEELGRELEALQRRAERAGDRIVRARHEHTARLVTAQLDQLTALRIGRERVLAVVRQQVVDLEGARLTLLEAGLGGAARERARESVLGELLGRALGELDGSARPALEEAT